MELGHNARFIFGHPDSGCSLFLLKLGHNACLLLRVGNDTSSSFCSAGFGFRPIAFSDHSPHRSATLLLLLAQEDSSAKAFRRVLANGSLFRGNLGRLWNLSGEPLLLKASAFSVTEASSGRARNTLTIQLPKQDRLVDWAGDAFGGNDIANSRRGDRTLGDWGSDPSICLTDSTSRSNPLNWLHLL